MIGMPSRLRSALVWKLSTMSAHCAAVPPAWPLGPPPPPLRTEPRAYVPTSAAFLMYELAACVIWPAFSFSVIIDRQPLVVLQAAACAGAAPPSAQAAATSAATVTSFV